MKRLILLAATFLFFAMPAIAQDRSQGSHPRAEVFVGYSYFGFALNDDDVSARSFNGVGVSLNGNFNRRFGLVSEFSGNFHHDRDRQEYTFLFGPRFSARNRKATVFGHVLVGGATARSGGDFSDTDPAAAFGGGVDVNAGRRAAIRFQADYLPIFAGNGFTAHNLRVMTGVVIKIGGN